MPSPHILTLSRHHQYISFTFHYCGASHHHGKKTHLLLLFFIVFFTLRLSGICCRSGLWVSSCVVISRGVVGCFSQYWQLLFFFRFQLMFGTVSLWIGSEFTRLWCYLPRCWLTDNSLCSFWFLRSSFGDLTSMLSFIAWERFPVCWFRWCLIKLLCVWRITLFQILFFYPFFISTCFGQDSL